MKKETMKQNTLKKELWQKQRRKRSKMLDVKKEK